MQVLYIYSIKKTSIFLYVFHLRLSLLGCTLTDYHFLIYTTVCHYWCNSLKDFFLKYGHQCQDQFGIFVKISWLESRKENRTCLASRFSVFQYIFYKTHINPQNSPLPNSATGYYATKLQSGKNATLRILCFIFVHLYYTEVHFRQCTRKNLLDLQMSVVHIQENWLFEDLLLVFYQCIN